MTNAETSSAVSSWIWETCLETSFSAYSITGSYPSSSSVLLNSSASLVHFSSFGRRTAIFSLEASVVSSVLSSLSESEVSVSFDDFCLFVSLSDFASGVGVSVSSSSPAPSFSVCALSLAASVASFLPHPPSTVVVRKMPNKRYAVFFFHVKFLYIPLREVSDSLYRLPLSSLA